MAGSGYKDYFQVLGVDRSADANAIKKAFRSLARQYHPDVNPGDAQAEARFKEISEAYEVLSDPEKRRRYEQFGQYWNRPEAWAGEPHPAWTSTSVATAISTISSTTCWAVSVVQAAVASKGVVSLGVASPVEDLQGAVSRVVPRLHALR